MVKRHFTRVLALAVSLLIAPAHGRDTTPSVPSSDAAVASAHPVATEAGIEILTAGGNAFDAAIAVAATLAVVEPTGSGLGGGGFFLLHRNDGDHNVMVDAREMAPANASETMYLDSNGMPVPQASIDGPLAAGIPGLAAGLAHLASRYGRLPLRKSLAPAIRAAWDGFAVDQRYVGMAAWRQNALKKSPEAARIFLRDGAPPPVGMLLKQPDLAGVLERLGDQGHDGFYRGLTAQQLVEGVRHGGGIWTQDDLAEYRVIERAPVMGQYRDVRVISAAPPSSGGVALIASLNMLQAYNLDRVATADRIHLIVESMRRAYHDRALYLGDPDFVSVPVERLIHPLYAEGLRATLQLNRATPSTVFIAAPPVPSGPSTTHLSVLDAEGNRVAATLSINLPFGAAHVAPGTGILLNNEMDDFSIKPGTPNAYGLIGAQANAIAPKKRPLSSMTPTFLESPTRVGILGTPGGSRIISMVLLGTLEFAAGRGPEQWVGIKRFHHQFWPDVIQWESGAFEPGIVTTLTERGHHLDEQAQPYGNMQAILFDKTTGRASAASDPRGIGSSKVIAAVMSKASTPNRVQTTGPVH